MLKFCPTCNQEKNITEFNKNKTRKDGYQRECRKCCHYHHNIHYHSKKSPRLKENIKEGYKICTSCNQELPLNLFKPGKGRFGVKSNCKLCFNQKWNQYQQKTGQNRKHNKLKRQTDPQWKLKANLRGRYLDALKRHTSEGKVNKHHSAIELLGCNIEFYKQYLEQQFKPDMTWENHGILWEIDHIKPCASFNLIDSIQQQKCFHYSNTQPLYYSDNRSKKDKYVLI
jgi:hypothetical protein